MDSFPPTWSYNCSPFLKFSEDILSNFCSKLLFGATLKNSRLIGTHLDYQQREKHYISAASGRTDLFRALLPLNLYHARDQQCASHQFLTTLIHFYIDRRYIESCKIERLILASWRSLEDLQNNFQRWSFVIPFLNRVSSSFCVSFFIWAPRNSYISRSVEEVVWHINKVRNVLILFNNLK